MLDFGAVVSRHRKYGWDHQPGSFDRLLDLLPVGTIYYGARHDRIDRFIAPTILVNVSPDSALRQEEIFGPILPVLEVDNLQRVVEFVNARPSPLGLYIFSED